MADIYSKEYVIEFLKKEGLPEYKIYHSILVSDLAVKIVQEVKEAGQQVDMKTVRTAALLHDIGVSKTIDDLSPNHCAIGGKLARKYGYLEEVARCMEAHENVANKKEASQVGMEMNRDNFFAQSWEEKIVTYADHVFVTLLGSRSAATVPMEAGRFVEQYSIDWGPLCAWSILALIPIVGITLFLNKHIVRGLTFGTVK